MDEIKYLISFCSGAMSMMDVSNVEYKLLETVIFKLKKLLNDVEENECINKEVSTIKFNHALFSEDQLKEIKVNDLNFSMRTKNCFYDNEIKTLYDLLQWEENKLLRLPNLGKKSIKEIKDYLKIHALSLKDSENV